MHLAHTSHPRGVQFGISWRGNIPAKITADPGAGLRMWFSNRVSVGVRDHAAAVVASNLLPSCPLDG